MFKKSKHERRYCIYGVHPHSEGNTLTDLKHYLYFTHQQANKTEDGGYNATNKSVIGKVLQLCSSAVMQKKIYIYTCLKFQITVKQRLLLINKKTRKRTKHKAITT